MFENYFFYGQVKRLLIVLGPYEAIRLEQLNHLVELLIGPMLRQLADTPLNSGLADDGWLKRLIAQQRPWFHEIKNVGHQVSSSRT